jgi:phage terminase large subunit GpA-like protein
MREAVARSLWKQKRQTPDQWGAENRVYSAKTGWPGQRNPHLTPYSIEFSRQFSGGKYKRVVMVTSAQTGKTETFLDIIGERLDNRPMPIIYVGPSKEFVRDQFEPRLVELFRQSTSLGRKVLGGIDSKKQTKTLKRVNGTRLRLAHAGSSTALKSDPASFALVDEYDEMIANVKGQGDPLGLIEARGDTYADFTVGVVSTPSTGMVEIERDEASGLEFWKAGDSDDVKSPIWRLWQEGTRHHWVWQCPHCRDWFVPRFALMVWPKNATPAQARREAFLKCPNNGCAIEDRNKRWMNARGRHVAPGQTIDAEGNVSGAPPDTSTLSFWISGLASPFVTFGDRVETYLKALKTNESAKIQTALNAQFGEIYVDGGGDVPAWEVVYENRSDYLRREVPDGARYLTFGADVQKNRIIYVTRAWGYRATSWLVDFGELHGNTAETEVWADLAELLRTPIDGSVIKVAFVDSGFRPGKREGVPVNRVYEFCRKHRRFVFPSKGSSHVMLRPLVKSKIEVTIKGDASPYGLELIRLDTDHWKRFVHERLRWPQDQPGAWYYPNDITEDYCRQLVAEARLITESGKPQWVQRSRENHFLDAEAMAAAAGHLLNVQHLRGLGRKPSPPEAGQMAEPTSAMAPAPHPPITTPVAPSAIAAVRKSRAERFAELARRFNT